jgi:acetylornithine/succinyldiaminopimelate/putrescine aminotransferase
MALNAPRAAALEAFLGTPLVWGAREGARFQNAADGRWYWNCHCNGGVFNLGHRHPRVLAALRDALDTVDLGNHYLEAPLRTALAERLAATTGGRLPGVVFSPSGGEATDVALKFARAHTGRTGIVSARGGYHGHTGLAMATGEPRWRERFHHELPGFAQVPFADAAALDAALGDDTAALILETIPATLGMPLPPPGYHAQAARLCRERGALLILDEVQTGLGRCGTVWAHEQDAVEPDLITTGKGLSGGLYPIAATLMRPEIHALYAEDPFIHISTFGGAEPGCAAALAVLDVVEEPGFLARVEALGARIEAGLADVGCDVRRRGLFMGLKFPGEGDGLTAARRLFDAGIFAVFAANDPSVTQFLPPLVIDDAEADAIVAAARAALG